MERTMRRSSSRLTLQMSGVIVSAGVLLAGAWTYSPAQPAPTRPRAPSVPAAAVADEQAPQQGRGGRGGGGGGVYKATVTPHWFHDNSRFWYRNDLRAGAKEF